MSNNTTSTSFSSANLTAAAPVPTSPTTFTSESANMLFKPLRTTSWSSAISNRILFVIAVSWILCSETFETPLWGLHEYPAGSPPK